MSSVRVSNTVNIRELSCFLRHDSPLEQIHCTLTRGENILPEESVRSQSPSNKISFCEIIHLFRRSQQNSFILS